MLLIKNGRVLDPASGTDAPRDVLLEGDRIAAVAPHGQLAARAQGAEILDAKELVVASGFRRILSQRLMSRRSMPRAS